jgi:hypothetical protein
LKKFLLKLILIAMLAIAGEPAFKDSHPIMFRATQAYPGTAATALLRSREFIPISGSSAKGVPNYAVWRATSGEYSLITS